MNGDSGTEAAARLTGLLGIVERVCAGDISARAAVDADLDPVGRLALQINAMLDGFQEREADLFKVGELHKNIVESLHDMVMIMDLDMIIRRVNPAVLSQLHFESSELIGKKVHEIAEGMEAIASADAFDQVVAMLPSQAEASLRTKDGRKIPVLLSHSVFHNTYGNIAGIVWLAKDISTLKTMHTELTVYAEELAKQNTLIKETTYNLVQMDKLSALGELSAGVAHELNQPLNCIKLISQSLLRDIEKDRLVVKELGQELQSVVQEVGKMAEIINHMRVFTRKTDEMVTELIDINEPIIGVFKLFGKQIETHGIEVVKELQEGLPKVTADANKIEQVVLNLVGNARMAVDSFRTDGKKISIKTAVSADGCHVEVIITDNGGGISEQNKKKIFAPFFTTKEPGKGTGLGLSVSKKIIEEHGGTLEFASKEGEGAIFTVTLPIVAVAPTGVEVKS
ncbi:ATP-binding protein [Bdellovibrionota bacterium FG-1]